jgi:hypothetical protein
MSTTTSDQKGSNVTPSKRLYVCHDTRKVKKMTEAVVRLRGFTRRLPADLRSSVAYFCNGRQVKETACQIKIADMLANLSDNPTDKKSRSMR